MKKSLLVITLLFLSTICHSQTAFNLQDLLSFHEKGLSYSSKQLLNNKWQLLTEGEDKKNHMKYRTFQMDHDIMRFSWLFLSNIEDRMREGTLDNITYTTFNDNGSLYIDILAWIKKDGFEKKKTQTNKIGTNGAYEIVTSYEKVYSRPFSMAFIYITKIYNRGNIIVGYSFELSWM